MNRAGMRALSLAAAIAIASAVACGANETKKEAPPEAPAAPAAASEPAASPVAGEAAQPAAPEGAGAPADVFARPEGSPGMWGDYCESNDECGWDHSCRPRACVDEKKAAKRDCDKTTPPPGTCECVEKHCTVRPADATTRPPSPETGCTTDIECAVDPATAICHVVDKPAGDVVQGPLRVEGPYCTCDRAEGRCRFQWSDPIPCTSFKECWYERSPRLRPVKAKKRRKKPVRPCKDGETDSVCQGEKGKKHCTVVGWSC